MNYIIVLFKNRKKRRILNEFIKEKNALDFFEREMRKSDKIVFRKEFECGRPCNYELGLLKRKDEKDGPIYIKDEMGRNLKLQVDDSDMQLIRIKKYNKEELLFDLQTNKRIRFYDFLNEYLDRDSVNLVSGLNHKIVVQNDANISLFSLKTQKECERFLSTLTDFSIKNNLLNLVVKDINTLHRKYLYSLLEEKGFDKRILYKQSTTHPGSK